MPVTTHEAHLISKRLMRLLALVVVVSVARSTYAVDSIAKRYRAEGLGRIRLDVDSDRGLKLITMAIEEADSNAVRMECHYAAVEAYTTLREYGKALVHAQIVEKHYLQLMEKHRQARRLSSEWHEWHEAASALAFVETFRSAAYLHLKQFKNAETSGKNGLRLFELTHDERHAIQMLVRLAEVAAAQKDFLKADTLLFQALPKAMTTYPGEEFTILEQIARLRQAEGKFREACAFATAAIDIHFKQKWYGGCEGALDIISTCAAKVVQPGVVSRIRVKVRRLKESLPDNRNDYSAMRGVWSVLKTELDE